jgi:hypothetical protein
MPLTSSASTHTSTQPLNLTAALGPILLTQQTRVITSFLPHLIMHYCMNYEDLNICIYVGTVGLLLYNNPTVSHI